MIPFLQRTMTTEEETSNNSLYEYEIDFTTGEMTGKKVYGIDALKVWIYKALKTQRYVNNAYTWDYGQELESLMGYGRDKSYINSEASRIIKDALSINSKINNCHSFQTELKEDQLYVQFVVDSVFGNGEVEIFV